jgi:hypothetical protein
MLTNDSNAYVAMSGNFMPAQRNFANFKEFDDCPSPILVEDENSLDKESESSTLEKQIERNQL